MTNKRIGIIPVVVATLVLWSMYAAFTRNVKSELAQINQDIETRRTVVLNKDCDPELLKEIIFINGYCGTEQDAEFIANTLIQRQKDTVPNGFKERVFGKDNRLKSLFALQSRDNGQVSAHLADSCHVLCGILNASRDKIGASMDTVFEYDAALYSGSDSIKVVVMKESEKTLFKRKEDNLKCENVLVRLQLHYRDSLGQPRSEVLGYLRTDKDGQAVFNGLNDTCSYSFLPIMDGFEYGRSKGVVGYEWNAQENLFKRLIHRIKDSINGSKGKQIEFIEKEHRIPLFTNTALRQIKSERGIIVRTPDEFMRELGRSKWGVLLAWWFLSLVILIHPKRKFDFQSGLVIACCMFLTGLSVLMMFSMVDPVNDEVRGWEMTIGVLIGVALAILLQCASIVECYDHGHKPFLDITTKVHWWPRGLGWLLLALFLTLLLWTPLGRAVGGMRVNLKLGPLPMFQPSEIAKYHILMFVSIFFVCNINRIINYSGPYTTDFGKKILTMAVTLLGLLALMGLYLALGDMGPGLVLGITFVLLYSFCKSKQDVNVGNSKMWLDVLKSDLMMMLYGMASYAMILWLFRLIGCDRWYIWGLLVWLVLWLVVGLLSTRENGPKIQLVWKKQVHETAIIMNLVVFIFIVGSTSGKDTGVWKRLGERTSMCTNTWGMMDKVYDDVKYGDWTDEVLDNPVSNTQVANGLWALASGGPFGQGWGHGKPSVVPAFHTDMILSSIGEQKGWVGLLAVIMAYGILLLTVARKGIKTGESLAIYLCVGVAIVTAVQLFVIALGSAGAIPLTGVTVPFLSYGRTSMVFNILAFGVVLSLITREDPAENEFVQKQRENIAKDYKRPGILLGLVFVGVALFTLGVWAKYQLLQRNKTILQPAFVINKQGDPVLEYNPRIGMITKTMYAGRIFDRNGLLLATSNKDDIDVERLSNYVDREQLETMRRCHQKRYYPFGEHLFFMVGDQNSGLLYSFDENNPVGYMAEAQHLSDLRGFDNILKDKEKRPVKVCLFTNKKREDPYQQPKEYITEPVVLRDYSALLPFLKDGSGRKLKKHNESVQKGALDLQLTVDAALQKEIQEKLAVYMPEQFGDKTLFNLMRTSVVVLDANNGDLLASANYPLPDYERLKDEEGAPYYSDNNRAKEWKAYTDRDLGTTLQTAPGSTAKVMSAMAGLRKMGAAASTKKYFVSSNNIIEDKDVKEPHGHKVTMEEAIVWSSNCYFINLVNDNDLYADLETVYKTIGVSLGGVVPYYYRPRKDEEWVERFHSIVTSNQYSALGKYNRFRKNENRNQVRMDAGEWKWAWGQGYAGYELKASPLNMARLASSIVNEGVMPSTQYVISTKETLRQEGSTTLLNKDVAAFLKGYMKGETFNHTINRAHVKDLPSNMGGKTGTAERTVFRNGEGVDKNDGWYMFFIEGDKEHGHNSLAVVVRIERGVGSSPAVRLSGNLLLGVLEEHHYMEKRQKK